MARKTFTQRIREGLANVRNELASLVGLGPRERPAPVEEEVIPPPPPSPTPTYDDFFPTPAPFPTYEGDNVVYHPAYLQTVPGKYNLYNQTVLGRWEVGNEIQPASIEDVRDLLNAAAMKSGYVNLVVGGTYMEAYPGQEEERITWMTYVYDMDSLNDIASDPDLRTGTDYVNELLAGFGEYWDDIETIQIVDR